MALAVGVLRFDLFHSPAASALRLREDKQGVTLSWGKCPIRKILEPEFFVLIEEAVETLILDQCSSTQSVDFANNPS